MKTSKQICLTTGGHPLTVGRVYGTHPGHPYAGESYVLVTDDLGAEGEFLADRFRPLTRQEEEDLVLREQAAAQSDAAPLTRSGIAFPAPSALPDGNPKTRFGAAKPPLALIPGPALVHIADAFRDGAAKYGPANWRDDPVTTSTYVNAALRHIVSYYDGEDVAEDSGVLHLAHAAACLAILIDAASQGSLNDDRPTKGTTSRVITEKTRKLAA